MFFRFFGLHRFDGLQRKTSHGRGSTPSREIHDVYLSAKLSINQPINLSINPSIYQSIYLSTYLSVSPSVYLSIFLAIYQSIDKAPIFPQNPPIHPSFFLCSDGQT